MWYCGGLPPCGVNTQKKSLALYPCFCLCLGLLQMTRRIPWRLMILQLLQILLTEDFTFTVLLLMLSPLSLFGGEGKIQLYIIYF